MHDLEKRCTVFQTELKGHTVVKKVDKHWTRDKAAMQSVLAPAPHLEPTSCLSSMTHKDSFLHNATRW